MNDEQNTQNTNANHEGVHKYITFKLGGEEYGIELLKLRELIGVLEITRIPRSRPYIRGLINLRGKVIPVVDLRTKFGMTAAEPTSQSVIIVVQLATPSGSVTTGILVDEVLEVRAIRQADIAPAPALHDQVDTSFLQGIGKVDKRIVFLLDIDRILSAGQQAEIRAAAEMDFSLTGR
ncbi:MAG TPA: chemotaxis protein CheW [Polyangiaceae bacterium]|jgi:purine-binding chemotaxis protein CheW|nr:chemotaxis protein CheW [Polyangiaceae bacterium]